MKGYMRSFSRPKDITKSTIEKRNAEEDELKKYDGIINKLAQAIIHKDKPTNQIENDYSTSKRNPSVATRSNLKLTISRTKDERNDKDFLINFMNSDNTSSIISPNNLHLLSDDDRNKSISYTEKFKNLSDLMIDDRNSYSECYFIKNSEDRMILNLYTILGRKSKELFLEEGDKEKISKTRLLFKKINNITIPKFDFETKESSEKIIKLDLEQSYKGLEDETNTEIKSNVSEDKKEEKFDLYSDEEKSKEKEECYFKKKEKPCFTLPDLVDIPNYKKIRRKIKQSNKENYDNFWDPEIDANTLSNINHNIICIEDIYNEKEKNVENEEDNNEERDIEINAEEIKSSDSESEEERENKGEIKDTEEMPKKGKIRFIEFCEVSPVQMGLSYMVDSNKIKEKLYNLELKERYDLKLDKINEFEEKVFPKQGYKLSNDLIYRIAINNDNNEIDESTRFTINSISIEKEIKRKNLAKHGKQKIIIERKANLQPLKGKLTEEPLTLKKTNKNVFKTISDYANKINKNGNHFLDEFDKKFESKEKIKNDSSYQIGNQDAIGNENSLKDLINNESLFSNKSSEFINKNDGEKSKNYKQKNKFNKNEQGPFYNSSNSSSNSQIKSKNKNNDIKKIYSDKESSSQNKKNSQSGNNSSSQLF